ncbi:CHAT domain-containing protein [Frankia sp. Cas3]|uniref:CHAT domain-containing protein n=1 Tax=Frankia sp. Cas3 TaxID=3073926 RepID=UPI002AD3DAF4|nr:CHAT domain-containing protein [Frankia sp. Cas3]
MDHEQRRLLAIFDRATTRRPADVDAAVAELRREAATRSRRRSGRAGFLLASVLMLRADLIGGHADLNEACRVLDGLLARRFLLGPDDRPTVLGALAEARAKLLDPWLADVLPSVSEAAHAAARFDEPPELDDAAEALDVFTQLNVPADLQAEFRRLSDAAVTAYEDSFNATRRHGAQVLARHLASYAELLALHEWLTGESGGYDRAIAMLADVAGGVPPKDRAGSADVRAPLAILLLARARIRRDRGDGAGWAADVGSLGRNLELLLDHAEAAPELLDDPMLTLTWQATVAAAHGWLGHALSRQVWDDAARLGLRTTVLFQRLHDRLAPWSVQESMRVSAAGLHDRTAFAILRSAAHASRASGASRAARRAVCVVEQGRAAYLREVQQTALDTQTAVDLAEAGHAKLAERLNGFLQAAAGLERRSRAEHGPGAELTGHQRTDGDDAHPMLADAVLANRRARAAARRDARAALTGAPEPPDDPWMDICVAAQPGTPLAYLVSLTTDMNLTSSLVSFVLVVRAWPDESTTVDVRWLPAADATSVFAAAARWTEPDTPDPADVEDILTWLDQAVAAPLVQVAGHPRRLAVVAGGMASFLPLPAARRADGRHLLESTVLEFAPSARLLTACRHRATRDADASCGRTPSRLITVADPESGGQTAPLRLARAETAAVRRILRAACTELAGPDATVGRLRPLLALVADRAVPTVVHFACHATAEARSPLDSKLWLAAHGGGAEGFTLADLLDHSWAGARLVTLSACETAVPGREVPNEALSLAGGLLAGGAEAVLATQRTVPDVAAAVLTARFYQEWTHQPADPAAALVDAQRWIIQAPAQEIREWVGGQFAPDISRVGVPLVEALRAPAGWGPFVLSGA